MASCPRGDKQLCVGTSYWCAQAHLRSPFMHFRLRYVHKEEIHVGLGTLVSLRETVCLRVPSQSLVAGFQA
jgi:hypothetical protein